MTQSYESTAESCYDCQAAKMTGISVPDFLQLFVITLVLKAAKQPLTTARSAGEIKA